MEYEWRKARASGDTNCVEVAFGSEEVLVRDSKDSGGPILIFTMAEWNAFVDGAKGGEFD